MKSRFISLLVAISLLGGCTQRLPLESAPLPFRQAEDSFKLGHFDRAVHGYRIFIDSNQAPELIPRAYYKLAQSEFRLGHHDRCLATLDELSRRYPAEEWRRVLELRGDAEHARGNAVSSVLFWERAHEIAEKPRQVLLRRRIADAIDRMDSDMLVRTRSVLTTETMRALVDTAMRRGGKGRVAAETPQTQAIAKLAGPTADPENVLAGLGEGGVKVGVLLPLSGKYAAYGQSSRKGIELAFAESDVELVIRDTEGEAHLARAAVDELAEDDNVVAVIGPLRSKVAQAVSPRAERAGLPMLALAQRRSITGRYVMQMAMTYEMQAARLADYAISTAGLRRVGVLFPRDGYGTALSDAFQDEVRSRGGKVVGAMAYEPGAEEFSVEVLTLQRWVDGDGLQAVFIPDYAATAGILGRALREVRPGVALLGSNGWHDPGQLGSAADALDGAVFVDGFFIGSQRPATQRFIAAYRAEHGGMPRILEAQSYDAASVARATLGMASINSRDGFVDALRGQKSFEGATGRINLASAGLERDLFVLKLDGRRIREVRAAGSGGANSLSFVPSR